MPAPRRPGNASGTLAGASTAPAFGATGGLARLVARLPSMGVPLAPVDLLALGAMCSPAAPARAGEAGPRLSLADALTAAPRVAAVREAQAEAAAADARVLSARRPADPLLGLGTTRYSGKRLVTWSQDIRWAGQRGLAVTTAEHLAGAAGFDADAALREAEHDVRARWLALARAEDAARLADDVLARARDLDAAIAARVEGGRSPRLDLVRANAERAGLAAAATAAGEERAAAWAELAALLGLDPGAAGGTDGTRPAPPPASELEALGAPARIENRAAVRAARARVAAAEAQAALAARRRYPPLTLELGATGGDPGLPGTDANASLIFALPFGAAPAEAEARAALDAERARLDGVLRDAAAELAAARHRAAGARATLAAYDADAVPAATEVAALTREAWDAGRGDITRLFEAERALLDVRQARLAAYIDTELAWGDLLLAAGSDHAAE